MTKTNEGRFFEDFRPGEVIAHATPRTVTGGDVALHTALYGSRFAVQSSDEFARACGMPRAPIDSLLAFNIVFGKTVPDISLNAVANLGYADGRFLAPVHVGDTLTAQSEVLGVKEISSGKAGIVYVRSTGLNQRGEAVLSYVRWVMLQKRDPDSPAPAPSVPNLPAAVAASDLSVPGGLDFASYNAPLAGSNHLWEDYQTGEHISHRDGMTLEESEHMMATRLYQNTARVHFDAHLQKGSRFGRRLVYGGHIISLARARSFNGLANACLVAGINAGTHAGPAFAGDTIYAWSEVLGRAEIPDRRDLGALRLRLVAVKDADPAAFPYKDGEGKYLPGVLLDLDYWALMPRRSGR